MRPRSARFRSFRPRMEALEGRELLAVCTVDRLTDTGEGQGLAGDLRYCIGQAQDGDTIRFSVEGIVTLARGALPDLIRSIAIEGPGPRALTVRGVPFLGILRVAPRATVSLEGLTIDRGVTRQEGGGIYNAGTLTINKCTISGNRARAGAGIFNSLGATLTITNSTISANVVVSISPGDTVGGGIYNRGTLTMTNSTLAGNRVMGLFTVSIGGGIHNDGTLTLSNSSLVENEAVPTFGVSLGGGISNFGTVSLGNSILARNAAVTGPDLFGSLTSSGYNLVGDSHGGSGFRRSDLLNVDPRLGPLQDNGGLTLTHALLPGSPAINRGHPKTYREGFDQRGEGFPRVVGERVDIGAFEVQGGGFSGDTAPPLAPDVAALLAGLESQPGLGAGWQGLTQVVNGAVRYETVRTVEESSAGRHQTAVTDDGRLSAKGSDGGQESGMKPEEESRLASSLTADVVW